MCQCKTSPNGTTVVCDPCATQIMSALLGLLPEQDQHLAEKPTVLSASEHRGMMSAVGGWLDTLEVAKK